MRKERKAEAAVLYIADSLYAAASGRRLGKRLSEILHPAQDFDAEEVIRSVAMRAGLEVRDEPA